MSSAAFPLLSHHRNFFSIMLNDNELIEFTYSENPDIIIDKHPPSSPSDEFYIKLYVHNVTRRCYFSQDDGEPTQDDVETSSDPVKERCVPYKANDGNIEALHAIKLTRFLDGDTRIPPHVLIIFAPVLWKFAREVTPVTIDDHSVLRPFVMEVRIIELEYYDRDNNPVQLTEFDSLITEASPSERNSFDVDSLEKVRFDKGMTEQCRICLEEFRVGMDVTRLYCSHYYHGDCIAQWLKSSTRPTCPLCRCALAN